VTTSRRSSTRLSTSTATVPSSLGKPRLRSFTGLRSALSAVPIVFFVSFCLGLSFGVLLVSFSDDDLVSAKVYTCTYSSVDPQSERLKGVFCYEGVSNGSPCPFALRVDYSSTIRVSEASIVEVNNFNSHNLWNTSILSRK